MLFSPVVLPAATQIPDFVRAQQGRGREEMGPQRMCYEASIEFNQRNSTQWNWSLSPHPPEPTTHQTSKGLPQRKNESTVQVIYVRKYEGLPIFIGV